MYVISISVKFVFGVSKELLQKDLITHNIIWLRQEKNNNVTVPHKFDFQQYGILTNVGSDNPMKSPFELRNTK